jgi:mannose/fructose/N-acetylgalactosamine-specific phosphotransferase system component IIB
MPVVWARVDDRLIHGQVVEGWLRLIQADRVLVVSDAVSRDEFQISLMRLALPASVTLETRSVDDSIALLPPAADVPGRLLVLFPGLDEVFRVLRAGVRFETVNLGGLHDAPGRRLVEPHLAFTPTEVRALLKMTKEGMRFDTRALPSDEDRPLNEVLAEADV